MSPANRRSFINWPSFPPEKPERHGRVHEPDPDGPTRIPDYHAPWMWSWTYRHAPSEMEYSPSVGPYHSKLKQKGKRDPGGFGIPGPTAYVALLDALDAGVFQ